MVPRSVFYFLAEFFSPKAIPEARFPVGRRRLPDSFRLLFDGNAKKPVTPSNAGSRNTAENRLNAVCTMAIPTGLIRRSCRGAPNRSHSGRRATVPRILYFKCANAARLAFAPQPTEANSTVIQVPIFPPSTRGTPIPHVTEPAVENACNSPMEALELWITPVKIVPARSVDSGLTAIFVNRWNAAVPAIGAAAAAIRSIPTSSKNRASISPPHTFRLGIRR